MRSKGEGGRGSGEAERSEGGILGKSVIVAAGIKNLGGGGGSGRVCERRGGGSLFCFG